MSSWKEDGHQKAQVMIISLEISVAPFLQVSGEGRSVGSGANNRELMLWNCGVGKRLLRVPWTTKRSNQSILKEINPKYSLEGLML